MLLFFLAWGAVAPAAYSYSAATPWTQSMSMQSLVYGSTTPNQLRLIMGRMADDIVRSEQMYPVIENHYYYDDNKSGAATVFVFENNFLAGLHYKSPKNQWMDLTYILPNMGDRQMNVRSFGAQHFDYFPFFPLYGIFE
jgi:hypothetical protein